MKAACMRVNCPYTTFAGNSRCCWFCISQSECEAEGLIGPYLHNPKTCGYLEMVEEEEV